MRSDKAEKRQSAISGARKAPQNAGLSGQARSVCGCGECVADEAVRVERVWAFALFGNREIAGNFARTALDLSCCGDNAKSFQFLERNVLLAVTGNMAAQNRGCGFWPALRTGRKLSLRGMALLFAGIGLPDGGTEMAFGGLQWRRGGLAMSLGGTPLSCWTGRRCHKAYQERRIARRA